MAISVCGYPQTTYFCPECGSSNIQAHDWWNASGKMECKECGCRCFIIEAEDSHPEDKKDNEEKEGFKE